MKEVAEYEEKYINYAGYWSAFHDGTIDVRQDSLNADDETKAKRFDI